MLTNKEVLIKGSEDAINNLIDSLTEEQKALLNINTSPYIIEYTSQDISETVDVPEEKHHELWKTMLSKREDAYNDGIKTSLEQTVESFFTEEIELTNETERMNASFEDLEAREKAEEPQHLKVQLLKSSLHGDVWEDYIENGDIWLTEKPIHDVEKYLKSYNVAQKGIRLVKPNPLELYQNIGYGTASDIEGKDFSTQEPMVFQEISKLAPPSDNTITVNDIQGQRPSQEFQVGDTVKVKSNNESTTVTAVQWKEDNGDLARHLGNPGESQWIYMLKGSNKTYKASDLSKELWQEPQLITKTEGPFSTTVYQVPSPFESNINYEFIISENQNQEQALEKANNFYNEVKDINTLEALESYLENGVDKKASELETEMNIINTFLQENDITTSDISYDREELIFYTNGRKVEATYEDLERLNIFPSNSRFSRLLDRQYLVDPIGLVQDARNKNLITAAEELVYLSSAKEVSREWKEDLDDDDEFGSSDRTFLTKDFYDRIGLKNTFVDNRLSAISKQEEEWGYMIQGDNIYTPQEPWLTESIINELTPATLTAEIKQRVEKTHNTEDLKDLRRMSKEEMQEILTSMIENEVSYSSSIKINNNYAYVVNDARHYKEIGRDLDLSKPRHEILEEIINRSQVYLKNLPSHHEDPEGLLEGEIRIMINISQDLLNHIYTQNQSKTMEKQEERAYQNGHVLISENQEEGNVSVNVVYNDKPHETQVKALKSLGFRYDSFNGCFTGIGYLPDEEPSEKQIKAKDYEMTIANYFSRSVEDELYIVKRKDFEQIVDASKAETYCNEVINRKKQSQTQDQAQSTAQPKAEDRDYIKGEFLLESHEIKFEGKPNAKQLAAIKSVGFHWSRENKVWQSEKPLSSDQVKLVKQAIDPKEAPNLKLPQEQQKSTAQPQAENRDYIEGVINAEGNEIKFDGKPNAKQLAAIKSVGFHWSRENKVWTNSETLTADQAKLVAQAIDPKLAPSIQLEEQKEPSEKAGYSTAAIINEDNMIATGDTVQNVEFKFDDKPHEEQLKAIKDLGFSWQKDSKTWKNENEMSSADLESLKEVVNPRLEKTTSQQQASGLANCEVINMNDLKENSDGSLDNVLLKFDGKPQQEQLKVIKELGFSWQKESKTWKAEKLSTTQQVALNKMIFAKSKQGIAEPKPGSKQPQVSF